MYFSDYLTYIFCSFAMYFSDFETKNYLCSFAFAGRVIEPSVNYSADRSRYSEWRSEGSSIKLWRYRPLSTSTSIVFLCCIVRVFLYFNSHCISTLHCACICSPLPLYICDIIWSVPSHSLCQDRDVDTILLPNQSRRCRLINRQRFLVSPDEETNF